MFVLFDLNSVSIRSLSLLSALKVAEPIPSKVGFSLSFINSSNKRLESFLKPFKSNK